MISTKRDYSPLHKDISKVFPDGCENLVQILFSPYLKEIKENSFICSCSLSKFKKKFKIVSNVLDPLEKFWSDNIDIVIAGGKMIDFCMNKMFEESDNDYDCFFTRVNYPEAIKSVLLENDFVVSAELGYLTELISTDANEYKSLKFQIINETYANQEHIIENFDIRACGICCDGENVYWIKGALQDIKRKRIVLNKLKHHLNVFERIHKYLEKGFSISVPDLAVASICLLDSVSHFDTFPNGESLVYDRNFERGREFRTAYVQGDGVYEDGTEVFGLPV